MSEYEELNSKNRQTEIEELVLKVAKFEPTKIAVEMEAEKKEDLNEKYKKYTLGSYNLEMSEIFQVGFRIGSMLGHDQIFPVDWRGNPDMDYGQVESWLKENQPELLSEIYDGINIPELTESKSVLDYYRELNEPSWLNKLHKMYVNMARIGDVDNYIGMKWLSWWYERNLIMFSSLARITESEDDRILFKVGCSHSKIVTNFLEESNVGEVVQPTCYLS